MIKDKGFTFVEVMIVLVVASILATMAYPSYVSSVREARRAEAKADIVRAQIMQEKFRVNNTSYAASAAALGIAASSPSYYQLATAAVFGKESTDYRVSATAQNDQTKDTENGVSCTTMGLLVESGVENYTPPECW